MKMGDTCEKQSSQGSTGGPIQIIGGNRLRDDCDFYVGDNGFDDENVPTRTSKEQKGVESQITRSIRQMERQLKHSLSSKVLKLNRDKHLLYCLPSEKRPNSSQLDASGTWLCYWMVHSLNLLSQDLSDELKSALVGFINKCKHPNGGYGGGYMQTAHLAPTYAAVNCLLSLGTREAYESIDRQKLYQFFLRMHQDDGSYTMHDGGERDVRGLYCALSIAKMTNIIDEGLTKNCVDFLVRCQTYEGGFGGLPDLEAHGGYSFCALAALAILNSESRCNLPKLLHWLSMRQFPFEGGFSGRTNKLVDACYSFWQGGAFPIIYKAMSLKERYIDILPADNWIFNQRALQEYLLTCCQSQGGGMQDKPGKSPDFYHTCYALSGLSIAQHFFLSLDNSETVVGDPDNELEITDPVHNIRQDLLGKAMKYFGALPFKPEVLE